GAPAFLVFLTSNHGVWSRADDSSYIELLVRLDRRLTAATARFAPDDVHLGTYGYTGIDGTEGKCRALVFAVAGPHRKSDVLAGTVDDAVEIEVSVVRQREVEILVSGAVPLEHRCKDLRQVVRVPCQRYLRSFCFLVHLLQCGPTDKIVVELDEVSVSECPRRQVVVLDIFRDVTAGDRVLRFHAVGGQPFPVRPQGLSCVYGGERVGYPT